MRKKVKKVGYLKARCEADLQVKIENFASRRRMDVSDIIRAACWDYVERHNLQMEGQLQT